MQDFSVGLCFERLTFDKPFKYYSNHLSQFNWGNEIYFDHMYYLRGNIQSLIEVIKAI